MAGECGTEKALVCVLVLELLSFFLFLEYKFLKN